MKKPMDTIDPLSLVVFVGRAMDPEPWFDQARALLGVSEILEPGIEASWSAAATPYQSVTGFHASFVYLMLVGYALENLCKGLLVRDGPLSKADQASIEGGVLPWMKHDLKRFLDDLGVKRDPAEEELVGRIEAATLWAGRYPIVRNARDLKFDTAPDVPGTLVKTIRESDVDVASRLVWKLLDRMAAPAQGPEPGVDPCP